LCAGFSWIRASGQRCPSSRRSLTNARFRASAIARKEPA
jgi:hypothetical protein